MSGSVVTACVVPGKPHPLLAADQSPAWRKVRQAFEALRAQLEASEVDLLLVYSAQWTSIIGHQMQADPAPEWVLVDPEWHALGSMPYRLAIDPEFAEAYVAAATRRGLHARTVAYRGFPVDTGTVVALKLLNPDNRFQASVVSCNMYADRSETVVLGKAAADAIAATGRKVAAIAVTSLSNRLFAEPIDPAHDQISSAKDDEWNRKLLELFEAGRLEDVAQLARQFSAQANGEQRFKAIWWLSAVAGAHNNYRGHVFDYQPIWGTGATVVQLTPTPGVAADPEFDEDSVEVYGGERSVLSGASASSSDAAPESSEEAPLPTPDRVDTDRAPPPVGAYPHARRVGDLLFLSGVGPRQPGTDAIPGGAVVAADGTPQDYDIEAQTRATLANVKAILEASGACLEDVVDVTAFVINMARDFAGYNRVYAELLGPIGPTRTTLEVRALPTPIAVELKVIARPRPKGSAPA